MTVYFSACIPMHLDVFLCTLGLYFYICLCTSVHSGLGEGLNSLTVVAVLSRTASSCDIGQSVPDDLLHCDGVMIN